MNSNPTFDSTVPHSARVWNYWLGGKDHFPVDREFGERFFEVLPEIVSIARASRAFLSRVVRYLAGEAGIRQFLDIGCGLPMADNTHEVAQRVAPDSQVVYVDNDPLVLAHARARLVSVPEGATTYIDADALEPASVLTRAAETLDFTEPVAVLLLGVLGQVPDIETARLVAGQFAGAMPPGSYLVVNDVTEPPGELCREQLRELDRTSGYGYRLAAPGDIADVLGGLGLVDPGVVPTPLWRPDPGQDTPELGVCCGVGVVR